MDRRRPRVVSVLGVGAMLAALVTAGTGAAVAAPANAAWQEKASATLSAVGGTTPIAPGSKPQPATRTPFQSVGTKGLPRPTSDDPRPPVRIAATSCVTGSWNYVDNNGVGRPSRNFQVQAWDEDTSSGDDLLATGITAGNGSYTLCFNNDDCLGCAGQDVYVKFISSNTLWQVRHPSDVYYYRTRRVWNLEDNTTFDFGSLQPSDGTHMRGLHAFDEANDAWNFKPGICWDQLDSTCRQVIINWTPSSTDGNFYNTSTNQVHLTAGAPDFPMVVVHEIAHAIMDDAYEDAPLTMNCAVPITSQGSAGCAWTEGFAVWFPTEVYNDRVWRDQFGQILDLENQTAGNGWGNGDITIARVAGALIDLSDANNEGTDRVAEGFGNIWSTFLNHVDNNFNQFWNDRGADGFDVSNDALGSLFQNTIDYGFMP